MHVATAIWRAAALCMLNAGAALAQLACLEAINATSKPVLAEMVLATGKDLPFDSGKYSICENIEVQSHGVVKTKFFVVNFDKPLPGEIGVCLPAICEDPDIMAIQQFLILTKHSLAGALHLTDNGFNPFNVKDDRVAWGSGTSIAVAIVFVLVAVAGFSSFLISSARRRQRSADAVGNASSDGGLLSQPREETNVRLPARFKFCEAFAVTGPEGSWASLCKVDKARPTDCLNGFRVLSMFFIVMGHGLLEPASITGYRNAECVVKSPFCLNAASTNIYAYLLLAGQLGVDTFFFIAGFLLSFVGKARKMPIVMGTLLRFARLLPLFGFVQMLYILVSPYLAFGPFSPRFQHEVFTACGNNTWWSELLFISAFYPWFPDQGGCMGWSWYLGVDMVFAIVGLMLLNLWKRQPRIAWATSFVMFAVCSAVTIQQSLHYDLQYSVLDQKKFGEYGKYLYNRPYSRLPGFLIGLVAPWALVALEQRGWQPPRTLLAKVVVILASLAALAVAAVCIFLPYTNSSGPGPQDTARAALQWTKWENALWITFSRPIWCMCWLVWTLGCYFGYLPFFNAVFAHWIWTPLASLTFGAYLFHPMIIKVVAGNSEEYMTYSATQALQRTVFFFILAYLFSIASWCLVEKPMATISGWLIPKGKSPRKPNTPADDTTANPATAATSSA